MLVLIWQIINNYWMPHQNLLVRNDYERKINYDWPHVIPIKFKACAEECGCKHTPHLVKPALIL